MRRSFDYVVSIIKISTKLFFKILFKISDMKFSSHSVIFFRKKRFKIFLHGRFIIIRLIVHVGNAQFLLYAIICIQV